MKSILLAIVCALCLSSCGTLFTSSKQDITFMGLPETRIYDNGKKLCEIPEDGIKTIKIKKKLSDKTLIAKKDGYKNTPVTIDATLNPISVINLTNILAWAIDLGTGKCFKWDADVVEIEMEKENSEK
jgi:hypothetical protein